MCGGGGGGGEGCVWWEGCTCVWGNLENGVDVGWWTCGCVCEGGGVAVVVVVGVGVDGSDFY